MNFKRLKRIADAGSIKCEASSDTGIVVVRFKYRGCQMQAQYSASIVGVYAFSLGDTEIDKFFDEMERKEVEQNDQAV